MEVSGINLPGSGANIPGKYEAVATGARVLSCLCRFDMSQLCKIHHGIEQQLVAGQPCKALGPLSPAVPFRLNVGHASVPTVPC